MCPSGAAFSSRRTLEGRGDSVGCGDTGQIATVRIHPRNPSLIHVASIGNPFAANKDRGVFRTIDGGKTWSNVLHVSMNPGAADVELHPDHPDVIFATIWHGFRKPWTIISGSPDGGIYKPNACISVVVKRAAHTSLNTPRR